jgi:hypothetical protein
MMEVIGLTVAEGSGTSSSKHPPTSIVVAASVTASAIDARPCGRVIFTFKPLRNNILSRYLVDGFIRSVV